MKYEGVNNEYSYIGNCEFSDEHNGRMKDFMDGMRERILKYVPVKEKAFG